jgi:hypothetical protein
LAVTKAETQKYKINNRDNNNKIITKNKYFPGYLFEWFVLTKIQHLAAEKGLCSVSARGDSSTFIMFDEINLYPTFLIF